MSLFKKATSRPTHLKAAFTGFAGSGKTLTAALLAVGLVNHMRAKKLPGHDKPALMFDTETSHRWIASLFDEAGIELEVAESRAYTDLKACLQDAIARSSVFMIDSITHPWIEFTEAYQKQKGRRRGLEFSDWNYLKTEWRKNFTEPFLTSNVHIIMCGRAGYEYSHYTDDSGKKQIEKTGVKMKAEGELGFEPSLVVHMEREQDLQEGRLYHVAHVIKDRRPGPRSLDGKTFRNPTFKTFFPHIEYLDLGSEMKTMDTSRSSEAEIPMEPKTREQYGVQREVVIEEIGNLMQTHFGRTGADKAKKLEMIQKFFAPTWKEVEDLMTLDDLRINYDRLHRELTGKPSRYGEADIEDSMPEEGGEAAATVK